MGSDRDSPSSRDIIDVTVPPIPDPIPDEFVDRETGELLTEEIASFAREQSGTCGGIGVGLEIVNAVLDDLRSFDERGTRPDELRYHVEMIAELERVLIETADAEIDTYENPLFDEEEDGADQAADEKSASETSYPRSAFKIGYVDRISKSGNLLAIPRDGSRDHYHVSAGIPGTECVLYDPEGTFELTSNISKKQVALPCSGIEEAQAYLEAHSDLPVREGEIIQVPKKVREGQTIELAGRDIDEIVVTEGGKTKYEHTLIQVTEIRDETAVGKIVKKNSIADGTRPDWVKKLVRSNQKRKKRRPKKKRRRSFKGRRTENRIVSGSTEDYTSSLNKLLKGYR